jgi:hypothetical protein
LIFRRMLIGTSRREGGRDSNRTQMLLCLRPRFRDSLRHSGASYRVAATGNAPQTALELGILVQMLMEHYRELVTKGDAERWFSIFPPKPSDGPELSRRHHNQRAQKP